MIRDSRETIALSAKRFVSGTAISRATGFAREMAMAAAFGTIPLVAAFWMAFRFAHLFRRLLGEGALHVAFVPHFEMLRQQETKKGARFFFDLSTAVALLLLLITTIAVLILGSFLLFGNLSSGSREVVRMTILILPALVFISLYALNTSLLNCEKFYFLPSVAPIALNLSWLIAVLFLWRLPTGKALEYLAMIIVLAFALQWLVTLPTVYRFLAKELGSKWWKNHRFSYREILKLMPPFLIGILGVGATQINSALDPLFARAANPQGPAFLWYAIRIQQLPLALFGVGLTGALLPSIARAVQNKDWNNYLYFLNFALRNIIAWMFPLSAALFSLGFASINLVYGHGVFSTEATVKTTLCLWVYGAALFPMAAVLIFAATFYAQKNYRIPTSISLVSVGVNIVLNSWFVFGLKMGAISVAIATTIASSLNAALLAYFLKKKEGFSLDNLAVAFLKTSLSCLLPTLATILFGYFVLRYNTWPWLLGKPFAPFPRNNSTSAL